MCAADLRRSPALDGLDVDFVEVNVRDRSSLAAAFDGADVVFHLAAMISIVGDPTGEVRKVNVEGPANVANAARDAGVERVVHCSSVHAFDLEKCGPSLDETGPRTIGGHAPAYDRSKYAGEQALLRAAGDDLDVVIVNPTGVIGPHDYAPSLNWRNHPGAARPEDPGQRRRRLRLRRRPRGGQRPDRRMGTRAPWRELSPVGHPDHAQGARTARRGDLRNPGPEVRRAVVVAHPARPAGDEADPADEDPAVHPRLVARPPLCPQRQPLQGGHRTRLPGATNPRDRRRHPQVVRRPTALNRAERRNAEPPALPMGEPRVDRVTWGTRASVGPAIRAEFRRLVNKHPPRQVYCLIATAGAP
ncbi:MAG: NAD-dependent epimerase/dehydratase family protein [Candidatus Microthrix sp.]|nr:NAD-dependent epimerase/dehydratase family protein [Candidatus Microthrix sp.]